FSSSSKALEQPYTRRTARMIRGNGSGTMKRGALALLTLGLLLPGCADDSPMTMDQIADLGHASVCGSAGAGAATCHARVILDEIGEPLATSGPSGYHPADLVSAYNISGGGSSATTIAIVDAYGYPNAESDLAVYRSQFGLPPCTTANGCFRKVDQNGGTTS